MNINNLQLDEETTSNVELSGETDFRNYLISIILKGYSRYQEELRNYYVSFRDLGPGSIAAVDPEERIVYIKKELADKLMDQSTSYESKVYVSDQISMLIRHELLHSILKHQSRTITAVAIYLGYDPSDMSEEEFEDVLSKIRRPSLLYRKYNAGQGVMLSNGAGDLELSKYYIERDVELQDAWGGLLLEDHPEWANYSFEELLAALQTKEKDIIRKLFKRRYGSTSDRKNFQLSREEDSVYNSTTTIDADMVSGVRMLSISDAISLSSAGAHNYISGYTCWLMDQLNQDLLDQLSQIGILVAKGDYETQIDEQQFNNLALTWQPDYEAINVVSVDELRKANPVLIIDDLDLYENIKPLSTVVCLGHACTILPHKGGLLVRKSLAACKFNQITASGQTRTTNQYRYSIVRDEVEDWYQSTRKKYIK